MKHLGYCELAATGECSHNVHIVQKCWSMIIGDGFFTVGRAYAYTRA
jgi:hypothetical protein